MTARHCELSATTWSNIDFWSGYGSSMGIRIVTGFVVRADLDHSSAVSIA